MSIRSDLKYAVKYPKAMERAKKEEVIYVFNLPPATPMFIRLMAPCSALSEDSDEYEKGELIITRKNVAFISQSPPRAILRADIVSTKEGTKYGEPQLTIVSKYEDNCLKLNLLTDLDKQRAMKIVGHLVRVKNEEKSSSGGKKLKLSSIFNRRNSSGKARKKKLSRSSSSGVKKSTSEDDSNDDDEALFNYGDEEVADYESKRMTSFATEKILNGAIPGKLISEISPDSFGDIRFVDPNAESDAQKQKNEKNAKTLPESPKDLKEDTPSKVDNSTFIDDFWAIWELFGKAHGISVEQVHFVINAFQEQDTDFSGMISEDAFVSLMKKLFQQLGVDEEIIEKDSRLLFDHYDTDKDGFIGMKESLLAYKVLSDHYNKNSIPYAFVFTDEKRQGVAGYASNGLSIPSIARECEAHAAAAGVLSKNDENSSVCSQKLHIAADDSQSKDIENQAKADADADAKKKADEEQAKEDEEARLEAEREAKKFVRGFWREWEIFGRGIGLSKLQVHHAINVYQKQDTDFSGDVSLDEFIVLMKSLLKGQNLSASIIEQNSKRVFASFDTNNNNLLELTEFILAYSTLSEQYGILMPVGFQLSEDLDNSVIGYK